MKINEFYYHLKGRDNFVTKNHTQNEIELIQVVHGDGTVLKNDMAFQLKSNFLYLIDARHPHIVHPADCDNYVRNKILLDADSFFDFCAETGISDSINIIFRMPPISTVANPEIDNLFKTIALLCEENDKESAGFAHAYILQILHFAARNRKKQVLLPTDDTIQAILNIVDETGGVTSLNAISERLNYSKYYICHLFKEKTGITLSEYLAEKRYEKSVRLLNTTSYTIEKISSLCGFANVSSFTRFFKEKNGLSPKSYRQSY